MQTTSKPVRVRLNDVVIAAPLRSKMDPERIRELKASLEREGQIQPVVVRPAAGGKWDLVAGHRRVEAARALGWKELDAAVREDLDDEAAFRVRWEENRAREDLDPLDRARAVAAYLELRRKAEPSMSQASAGKELGVSQTEVSHALLLLEQPAAVQEHVRAGRLTPGHVEKALRRARQRLEAVKAKEGLTDADVDAAVATFAGQIAEQGLDVRTAEKDALHFAENVRWEQRRRRAEVDSRAFDKVLAKVKHRDCPRHKGVSAQELQERDQGALLTGTCGDRWWGATGELYLTPAEIKAIERQKEEARKARQAAAKTPRKVERDYAAFFSRASVAQWAQGLLDTAKRSGIGELVVTPREMDAKLLLAAFPAAPGDEDLGGRGPLYFRAVKVPDGDGGAFLTRVQIGEFRSSASVQDNVVEGGDVGRVRHARAALLAIQRKALGVRQDDGDLWPARAGGFALGETARVNARFEVKSHRGRQGPILAFDLTLAAARGELAAVLGAAITRKVLPLRDLEKVPVKGAAKKEARPRKKRR